MIKTGIDFAKRILFAGKIRLVFYHCFYGNIAKLLSVLLGDINNNSSNRAVSWVYKIDVSSLDSRRKYFIIVYFRSCRSLTPVEDISDYMTSWHNNFIKSFHSHYEKGKHFKRYSTFLSLISPNAFKKLDWSLVKVLRTILSKKLTILSVWQNKENIIWQQANLPRQVFKLISRCFKITILCSSVKGPKRVVDEVSKKVGSYITLVMKCVSLKTILSQLFSQRPMISIIKRLQYTVRYLSYRL